MAQELYIHIQTSYSIQVPYSEAEADPRKQGAKAGVTLSGVHVCHRAHSYEQHVFGLHE